MIPVSPDGLWLSRCDGARGVIVGVGIVSLLERISIDPGVVHDRSAIRGSRMRVSDVLSLLAAGADEAERSSRIALPLR